MNNAHPPRPDARVSQRFSAQKTVDTRPEILLRKALHAHGLRFRIQVPVPGLPRRRIDVALTRVKLAVFVDGCFWHGCPDHSVTPKTNTEWWLNKLARNRDRDRETNEHLARVGWTVLRLWEHIPPEEGANLVEGCYRELIS